MKIFFFNLLEYAAGDNNQYMVMITRWLQIVTEVLVLMFPEGWPRAWHRSEVLLVAFFHANS